MKKKLPPKPWFFPRPVLLVSTRDKAGKDNIITVSWAGVACSAPPMITISLRPTRQSHAAILATKEFVANIPTTRQIAAVEICGTKSGKDSDKFAELRLGKLAGKVVSAPMIAECPISLECKVKEILPLGSHDLFVAEIVQVHAHYAIVREDGEIDDKALEYLAWGSEEFLKVVRMRGHVRVPRFQ